MYIGTEDPALKANRRMHAVLTEIGIDHGYREIEGVAHNLGKLAEQVQTENFAIAGRGFKLPIE